MSVLFATPLAGIGIIIGLMAVMKARLGLDNDITGIVVAMSFLLLLVTECGLIWLLMQHTRAEKKTEYKQPPQVKDVVIRGLPEGNTPPIYEPMPSVTDHTTRTLDPVLLEPKS